MALTGRCLACGHTGEMDRAIRKSNLHQIGFLIGLLFYFVPGLVFAAWSWGQPWCPNCGGSKIAKK